MITHKKTRQPVPERYFYGHFNRVIWILQILFLLFGSILITNSTADSSGKQNHIFATWEGFEADKCASIWLIKRFVDKEAVFRFYPKGTSITGAIEFDTPEADLRRYHNLAAYEAILRDYALDDPTLIHIGKIIHDIEVNTWQHKRFEETLIIQEDIRKISGQHPDPQSLVPAILTYFDRLYVQLKK
jgi:hypothetical protein